MPPKDIQRGCACVAQIRGGHVEQALRVGVRVDRGQQTALNTPPVEEHLGHRGQTVGGTGRVGDDRVLRRVEAVLVHAQHDRDVLVAGWRGDDDFLGPSLDVGFGFGSVGEETRRFDEGAHLLPRDVGRITFGGDLNLAAVDDERLFAGFDVARIDAVVAVVLEEMRVRRGVEQVVDGHHLDIVRVAFEKRFEGLATDAAEAIDAYAYCH